MGYYIETPNRLNKANYICDKYKGQVISQTEAEKLIGSEEFVVICVVDNGIFEAAGYCYCEKEFKYFTHPSDTRRKIWLKLKDVKQAKIDCGYEK